MQKAVSILASPPNYVKQGIIKSNFAIPACQWFFSLVLPKSRKSETSPVRNCPVRTMSGDEGSDIIIFDEQTHKKLLSCLADDEREAVILASVFGGIGLRCRVSQQIFKHEPPPAGTYTVVFGNDEGGGWICFKNNHYLYLLFFIFLFFKWPQSRRNGILQTHSLGQQKTKRCSLKRYKTVRRNLMIRQSTREKIRRCSCQYSSSFSQREQQSKFVTNGYV